MTTKANRQKALLQIVSGGAAANQHDLVRLLKRHGFEATQASVSRDARELGLVKVDGVYRRLRNNIPAAGQSTIQDGVHDLITAIEPVGANLVVVRTRVGGAAPVAVEIDKRWGNVVVGTVAGDDTLFIAVRSRSAQGQVIAQLRRWATAGEPARN